MTTRRTSKAAAAVRQNVEAVTEATVAVAQESLAIGAEAAETLVKAGTEVTTKTVEQASKLTKQNLEKTTMTMFQRYEDLNGFGKENVDAIVKSTTLLTKGLEELTQVLFKMSQESLETTMAAAKSAMACTTLRQIIDLQNDLAKTGFDKLLAESTKVSELSLKVANDALEPIQARVNVTIEKLVKPVAA